MRSVSLRAALVVLLVAAVAGCGLTLGGGPALIAPPDAAEITCAPAVPLVFTWLAVPNATGYVLEVVTTGTPPLPVVSQTVTATTASWTYTLPHCGASYRWRVGATFTSSPTAWSAYWTFTILPVPPP
ncbi:MAG: hypothetical protein QME77_01650 [bacterium]|nr:hypothetical protein [bacterium]